MLASVDTAHTVDGDLLDEEFPCDEVVSRRLSSQNHAACRSAGLIGIRDRRQSLRCGWYVELCHGASCRCDHWVPTLTALSAKAQGSVSRVPHASDSLVRSDHDNPARIRRA
jgi:hypothetical protein